MAARTTKSEKTASTAITFRIGKQSYRILTGQTRDYLSTRGENGGWSIVDDSATLAVVDALSKQVSRLKPLA
jgi:hypothetical protein